MCPEQGSESGRGKTHHTRAHIDISSKVRQHEGIIARVQFVLEQSFALQAKLLIS
jgi:hypothetical protein